jgi:signal transduction histidine kinase
MKIFGEELGGIGRWYVVLPPLLLIGFLVGLFFLAAEGQTRLNAANERVHNALLRQQSLIEFLAAITDVESAERGYLLTGERSYLERYRAGVPGVVAALERVHQYYGDEPGGNDFRDLRLLTGKELGELEVSVALYAKGSAAPSVTLGTDAGRRTMDAIVRVGNAMRMEESVKLSDATKAWESDFRMSRWVSGSGALLNIGLVLLGTSLFYTDIRRRSQQASGLRDRKEELEREVEARTKDLAALSTHLQGVSEQEKSALSRELHDELGGLLVAARMDLSWLQQRLSTSDPGIDQRFKRIHESLSAGVDLKRRVVEELRPTLLDNMGLFTALRWQFKETCRRAGMHCTETIPESELKFDPDASIGVFRVAQEALTNILKHAEARSADLYIEMDADIFLMRISDDGKGIPPLRLQHGISHGLASMRHRIAGLGGKWDIRAAASGGTVLTATIPLARMLPKVEPVSVEAEADAAPLTRARSTIADPAIQLR